MHGTICDTGSALEALPPAPPLKPNLERALRRREADLEAEVQAACWLHERLCREANLVFWEVAELSDRRRKIGELLLLRGRG